jgi:hypothetical protein
MRSDRISFLAAVTAGAGLVGFIGVFADWFSLGYQASGTTVILEYDGTIHTSGAIAVAAGLGALAFGCAYMLFEDPAIRRITAVLMAASSLVLFLSSVVGFASVGEALGSDPFLPGVEGRAEYVASPAIGLTLSLIAGVIASFASVVLVSRRETGAETVAEVEPA